MEYKTFHISISYNELISHALPVAFDYCAHEALFLCLVSEKLKLVDPQAPVLKGHLFFTQAILEAYKSKLSERYEMHREDLLEISTVELKFYAK